jgi:hypothetical protein
MGFAKVQLMGNLGKDPEAFGFEGRNGKSEGVKFSIAVNRGKEDAKVTDWFDCLCFGQTWACRNSESSRCRALSFFCALDCIPSRRRSARPTHIFEVSRGR